MYFGMSGQEYEGYDVFGLISQYNQIVLYLGMSAMSGMRSMRGMRVMTYLGSFYK